MSTALENTRALASSLRRRLDDALQRLDTSERTMRLLASIHCEEIVQQRASMEYGVAALALSQLLIELGQANPGSDALIDLDTGQRLPLNTPFSPAWMTGVRN